MNEILKKYFQEELLKHQLFSKAVVAIQRGSVWSNADTDATVDAQLLERLAAKKTSEKHRKFSFPWQVIYWLGKPGIAVICSVPKKTQEATIQKNYELLVSCLDAATKSYFANHDPLTGVLNRHGIQWQLEKLTQNSLTTESVAIDQQQPNQNELVLFSFDIDRFKNINDSYGHDVGDLILTIFAARISFVLPELIERFGIQCVFGRPGGEEFELIVWGQAGAIQTDQIVGELLKCIRVPVLPSSDDIKKLNKKSWTSFKDFPNIANPVTASIGVASEVFKNPIIKATEESYSQLRRSADLALYRAKNDGRNCYRVFNEIRLNHGRVHEYHEDSDLVVIDIGLTVGVKLGDLYRAFFPPFQNQPIDICDDRGSKKTLGHYPMIESARLLVIDTQEKISICTIIDRETSSNIPKGALLQLVHKGSLPFMNIRPKQLPINVFPLDRAVEYITELQKCNSLHSVVRVRGDYNDDVKSKDQFLTGIVAALHLQSPTPLRIFGGNGSGLYVVVKTNAGQSPSPAEKKTLITSLLAELSPFLDNITAGVVVPEVLPENADTSGESMLFYASAAINAADHSVPESAIILFDKSTPSETMQKWRKIRSIEDALVDYQKFKISGFNDASLDNKLGLIILEAFGKEYYSIGEAAFSSAHNADPRSIFSANLALLKAIREDYDGAFILFSGLIEFIKKSSSSKLYALAFAKSAIEATGKANLNVSDFKDIVVLVLSAFKAPLTNSVYSSWRKDVAVEAEKLGVLS